jgi:hypothetical protein
MTSVFCGFPNCPVGGLTQSAVVASPGVAHTQSRDGALHDLAELRAPWNVGRFPG